MRPLKLIISAFASYSGKVELDMTKLGTSGIYLITGDTGSGKTTIFDAISFALFGQPSGNTRESNSLRSEYASPEASTYVELTFLYRNKIYIVKRNPIYMRKALRGEGMTQQNADATLTRPDGTLVSGATKVTAEIENILGVNRSQFCQIAMIAQGDFMKILHQDTKGRLEIFRKIFQTDNYKNLQEKIKQLTKEASDSCDLLKNSVNQYIGGFLSPQNDSSELKFDFYSLDKFLEFSEGVIQEDEEQNLKLEEKLANLDKSITELSNRVQQIEAQKKVVEDLAKVQNRLKTDKESEETVCKSLEAEKQKIPEVEKDKERCVELEQELQWHNDYETKSKQCNEKRAFIEDTDKRCKNGADCVKASADKLGEFEKELQGLENVETEKFQVENNIKINNDSIAQLTKVKTDITSYKNDLNALKTQQDLYLDLQKHADVKQHDYADLNRRFLEEQAGIMAENLLPEQPCPVCGSLSHPQLAQKKENAPTEAQLKTAEKAWQDALKTATDASQKASEMKGDCDAQNKALQETLHAMFPDYSIENEDKLLSDRTSKLAEVAEKLNLDLKQITEKVNRKNELSESVKTEKGNLERYEKALDDLKDKMTIAKTEVSGLESQLDELKQKMKYDSKEAVQQQKKETTGRITAHEEAMKELSEKWQNLQQEIAKNEGVANTLSQQVIPGLNLEVEQEKQKLAETEDMKKQKQTLKNELFARLKNNKGVRQNVNEKSSEAQSAERRLTWLQTLSNTVNGKLTCRDKISLETFIQMTYFDKIIRHANLRLQKMSGGQYRLTRASTGGGNAQVGLDLNVYDTYSGKERSVTTLSGGESFMAALSLALGLSDEIQASAGGVQIDTTFVDEGFGSLDDESLQVALRTLQNLAQNNHLIGIISHVSALKNIEKKIVVTKTATQGSDARIVNS